MTTPTIQALGITQEGAPTRWKARGYVVVYPRTFYTDVNGLLALARF
jgi:hypothetical protein